MMALKFMPIAKFCVNHLQGRSNVLKSNANRAAFVRRGILYAPTKRNNPAPAAPTALKNFQIQCPVMRVVYKDKDTGASMHKILNRDKALELALLYELDLVLGNVVHARQTFYSFFSSYKCNK